MQLADFTAEIHRPSAGFRWLRQHDLVLAAAGRDGETYNPLVSAKGLFIDFAKLEPTDSAVLAFADRYGDLLRAGPTTLKFWKESIERLNYGVGLWQAIGQYRASGRKDASCLAPYIRWQKGEITTAPWLMLRQRSYNQGELWQAANDVLFFLLNGQMAPLFENQPDRQVATLLVEPDRDHTLDFYVRLTNLLDVIWLQFAFAVRGDERFASCKECGASFKIKGKREDKMFCSDACRVRAHRGRWNKVDELYRLGRGAKEISSEVGLPIATIKKWLKVKE